MIRTFEQMVQDALHARRVQECTGVECEGIEVSEPEWCRLLQQRPGDPFIGLSPTSCKPETLCGLKIIRAGTCIEEKLT